MSRGPDAATLLGRALLASAEQCGCPVGVTGQDWTGWASATFTGARHHLTLSAPASDALAAWSASLPGIEFNLRGHLVADVVVERMQRGGGQMMISLEVLTIEER